jgi:uncharacterized phage-associated protein
MQATAVLLRYDRTRRMDRIRLLKLLFIADRESLVEGGSPIIGGRIVAMPNGPVLDDVYGLIKQDAMYADEWDRHIHTDGHAIELVADPGSGSLGKGDVAKLREVSERYHNFDAWELVDLTHQFAEWVSAWGRATADGKKMAPMSWDDVLIGSGKADWIPEIERDAAASSAFDSLLAGVR